MGVLKFGCKFSGEASLAPGTGEDWDPNPPGVKGLMQKDQMFHEIILFLSSMYFFQCNIYFINIINLCLHCQSFFLGWNSAVWF